jgi:ABC-type dipeptide/oligopeptide/nickel transport system permease component
MTWGLTPIRPRAKKPRLVQRAWSVFALALEFDFHHAIRVRTVVTAVLLGRRHLTLALLVSAFAPACSICVVVHSLPHNSEDLLIDRRECIRLAYA